MANFKTHITVAATLSTIVGAALYSANITTVLTTLVIIMLGTIGGILPDIDSDHSTSIRLVFDTVAGLLAFAVLFYTLKSSSILVALIAFLGSIFIVSVVLFTVFKKFTSHRGIFHSVPMAFIFGLMTVLLFHFIFHMELAFSWLSGCMVIFGVFVHLILDECYSVDLSGGRFKKSFGTALTFFQMGRSLSYISLYALVIALFFIVPGRSVFTKKMANGKNWALISTRFWPNYRSAAVVPRHKLPRPLLT